jgi:hypothetical protein
MTPTPAFAGAWIAPEGGQEIWTNVVGERKETSVYETSVYWELPLGEDTSFVASPWIETNYDTEDGWRGEATVGVKRAVFRDDNYAVAIAGSALWRSHPDPECSEGGAELRVLAGGSVRPAGAFMNVEVAARALKGGCESAEAEVSAGFRPHPRWLALGQVFVDAPQDGEEVVRGQLSLVRFGNEGRGIQLGVRARLDGEDREPALVLGLWGTPGDALF